MRDRFCLAKQLPPLDPEQREHLLRRALPQVHELTDADVQDVMKRVPSGSIRRLQGLSSMIINCARGLDGYKVTPRREHVLEALAQVQGSEEEKGKAAAQCGLAGPSVALQ